MNPVRLLLLSSLLSSAALAFTPPAPPPLPSGLSALDGLKVKRIVESLATGDEAKALKRWKKLTERKGQALGKTGLRKLAKYVAHGAAMASTSFQNFDQKSKQIFQLLSGATQALHEGSRTAARPVSGRAQSGPTREGPAKPSTGALTGPERQAATRRVQEMIRALEDGDLSGFTRGLARDFSQDRSILENAIRDEARSQSNVQIQVFVNGIQASGDTVTVRFSWNRQASDIRSGASDGTKGAATFFLSRKTMEVTRMNGPLPFGVRDRDLVEQAGGGPAKLIGTGRPVRVGGEHGPAGSGNAGSGGGY